MNSSSSGPPGHSREDTFQPPPRGYLCHNCGKGGHYIQHCPSAKGGKYLRMLSLPVGIPESMLVECAMDDPAPKFITRDRRLVKRRVDASAFHEVTLMDTVGGITAGKEWETPSTPPPPPLESSDSLPLPEAVDLVEKRKAYECIMDGKLAVVPMRMPCCRRLLCKGCFDAMVEAAFAEDVGDGLVCPNCSEPLILDDVVRATDEEKQISDLLKASTG
ncbi:unnamed protein product [Phytomonas sp. EM1]|nr:unnamed protein product [Phytomonas sp. EM1]|eukprot:CCW62144.1 unnamed protein product [Phytomonas sp. isolate EM1]